MDQWDDKMTREIIKAALQKLIDKGMTSAALIRRDGTPIEFAEKQRGSTNWRAIAVASSTFLNYSEMIANEMYKGLFETSILETDFERVVLAKVDNITLLLVTIPKQKDYTLYMLNMMSTVNELAEIIK